MPFLLCTLGLTQYILYTNELDVFNVCTFLSFFYYIFCNYIFKIQKYCTSTSTILPPPFMHCPNHPYPLNTTKYEAFIKLAV